MYGAYWTDPKTKKWAFASSTKATYMTNTGGLEHFTFGNSSTEGRCQPELSYKGGFSFLLLFYLFLLLIWSIGTYILWFKARLSTHYVKGPEIAGEYKAVIELAYVMNKQLSKQGDDPNVLREMVSRNKIRQDLDGGIMKYRVFPQDYEHEGWRWPGDAGLQTYIYIGVAICAFVFPVVFFIIMN